MLKQLKLILLFLLIAVAGNFNLTARTDPSVTQTNQSVADEIIAREKASFAAWQRKDKAFYADYWADDFTEFLPSNPYRDTKANLMSKFDQMVEDWKIADFQFYNPHVQVYGDVAVLTYNESISGKFKDQPSSYTGKVTMVYVKQAGRWRGVHYHESTNPSAK